MLNNTYQALFVQLELGRLRSARPWTRQRRIVDHLPNAARRNKHASLQWFVFCCVLLLLLMGCSSQKAQQEESLEKWLQLAEESRGHSPQIKAREMLDLYEITPETITTEDPVLDKVLPEDQVTIRLREASVRSVLRGLARAADQNMVINQSVTGQMSVDIQDVPWNHAFQSILNAQGLTYSWEGDVLRVKSMQDLQNELEISSLQEELSRLRMDTESLAPLANKIVKINYADAEKLGENLEKFLTRDREGQVRGHIAVNQETNSLVIQASRNDLERMERMIQHLDRSRSQVLIEANIVEATRTTARELGMRWSGRYITSSGSLDDFGVVGEPIQPEESFLGLEGMSLGIAAGRITGNVLYAQLQALEREGKLKILSSPSITTMDNQMAFTEHGQRVPYETINEDGDRIVEFEDAAIRLEVVPSIINGQHMKMDIKVKKDEVDFTREVRGNPLIRTKQTETKLVVQDGETIVISGLSKQTVSNQESGVPGLKNVPGLGWMFQGQEREDEMEEFMIFITPSILRAKGN